MTFTPEELQGIRNALIDAKNAMKLIDEKLALIQELESANKKLKDHEDGVALLVSAAQTLSDALAGENSDKIEHKILFDIRVGLVQYLTTRRYA